MTTKQERVEVEEWVEVEVEEWAGTKQQTGRQIEAKQEPKTQKITENRTNNLKCVCGGALPVIRKMSSTRD